MTVESGVLLAIEGLRTYFATPEGQLKAVDGLDLTVAPGEVVGLVGESGCGKSVASLSIMRLIEAPGSIEGGSIQFDGLDVLSLTENELSELRGNRIAMIFQQPQSALDPVMRVGKQVEEVLRLHTSLDRRASEDRAIELLRQVGISDPASRARAYPHELSGGMAQRVMIAMALACSPQLIIADEPTTSLDVTIQAQIIDLLRALCATGDTAVILITHDLELVGEIARKVAVMYAGHIVEESEIDELYARPLHPYTQGLIASMPVIGEDRERLKPIPGTVPVPIDLGPGCRFAPRCEARQLYQLDVCTKLDPPMSELLPAHKVRCWLYQSSEVHVAPLDAAST